MMISIRYHSMYVCFRPFPLDIVMYSGARLAYPLRLPFLIQSTTKPMTYVPPCRIFICLYYL